MYIFIPTETLFVSIHASAQEATAVRGLPFDRFAVSIHASAQEATNYQLHKTTMVVSFNPRLRAGGDLS